MNPFAAIGGAFLIFLLFIFMIVVIISAIMLLYYRITDKAIDSHKNRIRRKHDSERKELLQLEHPVYEIAAEELYAVTAEEYEADMRSKAQKSPLNGYDFDLLHLEALIRPIDFQHPALN